jgi:hypothetical protein
MMDAPLIFGMTLEEIPSQGSYLKPSMKERNLWENKPQLRLPECKIGLAWAGSPSHRNDQFRTMDPAFLSPLAELLSSKHAIFFSLQRFDGRRASFPPFPLEKELIQECDTLDKTSAFLSYLDLVITVDTSIAHLAGAIGKEVWILLPFVPDWRWMLYRQDSPWYSTARLFRQKKAGDWEGVIQEVKEALIVKMRERRTECVF